MDTFADANYTEVLTYQTNRCASWVLLHSQKQAAKRIGLYENVDKIDFMGFKQNVYARAISILNCRYLKFIIIIISRW